MIFKVFLLCIALLKPDIADIQNAERERIGLAPFERDAVLEAVAEMRVNDMLANEYVGHNGFGRIVAEYRQDWTLGAENIALNNYEDPAAVAVSAWSNSPRHWENVVEPRFTRVGCYSHTDATRLTLIVCLYTD